MKDQHINGTHASQDITPLFKLSQGPRRRVCKLEELVDIITEESILVF